MPLHPDTDYAWNGEVSLAYQVVGSGPIDLLYLQGYASHVDLNWESPALSRFLRGLTDFSRLIVTDRRGWGCSDRFSPFDVAPLETMTDDLLCVLDAAGSERAVVFGTQDCGLNASLFAATYPERTRGLVLCDAFSKYAFDTAADVAPEFEDRWAGRDFDEAWETNLADIADRWGRASFSAHWPDAREAEWHTRFSRAAIPPGGLVAEMRRYRHSDIRPVYPAIHVPTLVVGGTGSTPIALAEHARYLARVIPGARLVLHDVGTGPWLHWYDRSPAILAEVESFVKGLGEEERALDRVLATVLFTDIVESTAAAARLGDAGWRDTVERHHSLARAMLDRYDGREIDTAGDGFFATFDGPGRAIRAAQALVATVGSLGIEIRAGVHTGECELVDGKPGGLAVNVGARIAALAGPSEVLVSETVKSLVAGSGIAFDDRGAHELKGVPGSWQLWAAR
jgi:class 3 adenylate cyclase